MKKEKRMRNIILNIKAVVCTCILFVFTGEVKAQDLHFTQFSFAPLQLNPALTGVFNGRARVSNTYRSQWTGLGDGYKTIHLSGDAPLGVSAARDNHFGVGFLLIQDKAGEAGYKTTIIEGSLAYTTGLSDQNSSYISMGFQAGLNQQSIDLTKATWDSQWNGDGFDPQLTSGESIQLEQHTYVDFNAGLLYYYIPNDADNFNIGAAVSHLNKPNVSFYTHGESPMLQKITVHTGGEVSLTKEEEIWIVPKALFMIQGNQKEITAGAYFKKKIQIKSRYTNYRKEAFFYIGGFYRNQDAFAVAARFEFNTLGLGLSYDVNTSSLSKVAGSSNAFELNLTFVPYLERGSKARNVKVLPRFF
jgi:type IX secretion system PorP/SprF family membrane protein